jgi:hypothetical protein
MQYAHHTDEVRPENLKVVIDFTTKYGTYCEAIMREILPERYHR